VSAAQHDNLGRVARSLLELGITDVVFVGGATIGLYLTDPAAPEPRHTFDVDVVTPVASRHAYNALEEKLRDAGHTPDPGGPICRWKIGGITVDLMPPDESILGFSNYWYAELVEHAQVLTLSDGTTIRHASAPYLIATKLEAFYGRGKGDYSFSHDLEDIIVVLDGREELVDELHDAPDEVKRYVAKAFRAFLADEEFTTSIEGHLPSDPASQARAAIILARMEQISRGT
jgi:predicted nucleotidyltransferase